MKTGRKRPDGEACPLKIHPLFPHGDAIPSTIGCKPLQNVAKAQGGKLSVWGIFCLTGQIWGAARGTGKEQIHMRTKTESIAGLLEAIGRAKQQKDFNILKDLKELRGKFGKVQKCDYLALLNKLIEKYSTDEAAVIHAALMKKVQAGDLEAIRLWNELSKENRDVGEGVQIVDDIKVK